jgi:putative transposase
MMMIDNSQKPQRRSIRMPCYDYADIGIYFVTICTRERECLFGDIVDSVMNLNCYGTIAESYWEEIPQHFNDVELDEFVIMPNHIHGIIIISAHAAGTACHNPTDDITPIRTFGNATAGSLPTIVGSFKSAASRYINKAANSPAKSIWHRGYFEHVVRSEKSLAKIREYIANNPIQWVSDRENPDRAQRLNTPDDLSEIFGD